MPLICSTDLDVLAPRSSVLHIPVTEQGFDSHGEKACDADPTTVTYGRGAEAEFALCRRNCFQDFCKGVDVD